MGHAMCLLMVEIRQCGAEQHDWWTESSTLEKRAGKSIPYAAILVFTRQKGASEPMHVLCNH